MERGENIFDFRRRVLNPDSRLSSPCVTHISGNPYSDDAAKANQPYTSTVKSSDDTGAKPKSKRHHGKPPRDSPEWIWEHLNAPYVYARYRLLKDGLPMGISNKVPELATDQRVGSIDINNQSGWYKHLPDEIKAGRQRSLMLDGPYIVMALRKGAGNAAVQWQLMYGDADFIVILSSHGRMEMNVLDALIHFLPRFFDPKSQSFRCERADLHQLFIVSTLIGAVVCPSLRSCYVMFLTSTRHAYSFESGIINCWL
jgi:hypothetical protein